MPSRAVGQHGWTSQPCHPSNSRFPERMDKLVLAPGTLLQYRHALRTRQSEQVHLTEDDDMSEIGFGILLGVVMSLLFAVVVILWAIINCVKYLQEIRDLLKDRKGD